MGTGMGRILYPLTIRVWVWYCSTLPIPYPLPSLDTTRTEHLHSYRSNIHNITSEKSKPPNHKAKNQTWASPIQCQIGNTLVTISTHQTTNPNPNMKTTKILYSLPYEPARKERKRSQSCQQQPTQILYSLPYVSTPTFCDTEELLLSHFTDMEFLLLCTR